MSRFLFLEIIAAVCMVRVSGDDTIISAPSSLLSNEMLSIIFLPASVSGAKSMPWPLYCLFSTSE